MSGGPFFPCRWRRIASNVSAACGIAIFAGCYSSSLEVDRRSAAEHGLKLVNGPAAAAPSVHGFSCATCHRARDEAGDTRILPGAALAGATLRPTYWGGVETELLRAINHCRVYFMDAQTPWTENDEDARAVYAYLESLEPSVSSAPLAVAPQPFTTVPVARDLPKGDALEGESIYRRACASCHGLAHTGQGRLGAKIPALPDESVASFAKYGFDATQTRLSFIEKVRHGGFFGLYGNMPLYSIEAMSDEEVSSLLTYLGLFP